MRWSAATAIAVLLAGCATGGGGGRDGGASSMDSGSDAGRVESDGGREDAFVPRDGGPGVTCTPETAAADCGALPCVDGYCCDQACEGGCRACNLPGREGSCTPYAAGTDPEAECADEPPSSCGTTGSCDGAGACALHGSSVTCDDGEACTTGDACDGAGTCRGAAPAECAPVAGNECCVGTCGAEGCRTDPSSCADVCGGASLTVGRSCLGCGAARAAGSCLGGAVHVCDATSHSLCQSVTCGGMTYVCTNSGGSWAWRTALACDDGDACTFGDACGAGACAGTSVSCASTPCITRSCNGTATCTEMAHPGTSCDDGDPCTYGESCNASGACVTGSSVTCTSTPCLTRSCNGTASCTETPRTGLSCDDGNACTHGETCAASGACAGGSSVTCPADTACLTYACNGTSTCAATPRTGSSCDDGDPATSDDRCQSDGSCRGTTCSSALTTVFSDDFTSPSSSTWTNGSDVVINTSNWRAYTSSQHGARISGGLFEITNRRGSSSPGHGQGYAYVRAGGTGSHYAAGYDPTLRNNAGQEIVWSFNMRRDNADSTDGGFSCSSSSSQNYITIGLAYVLAASTASGLDASASTCSPTGTSHGYAVVMGGSSRRVRLVRFANGLRNGTLTNIVESGSFTASSYFSVRVTYSAATDQWRLEVRSDGSSSFANPAAGTYSFSSTGTDATYVTEPLAFSGPYFQTGCTGLCSSTYTARFDNVSVGLRCAP